MLQTTTRDGGVSFSVRVAPRASRNLIAGEEAGALKVRLTASPVDGKANKALIKFVAKALRLPASRVRLISGEKSRDKRLMVEGLGADELRARLGV